MQSKAQPGRYESSTDLPNVLQQAFADHQAGRFDKAIASYRCFLEDNPGNPTALQLLGVLHSQRGDYRTAILLLQESLRTFSGQPEVENNLGNAYSKSGRLDDAAGCYTRAIALYPEYIDALRNLGLCYLKLKRFELARDSLRRCLDIRADDAPTWMSLGIAYSDDKDYTAAIPCYEKSIELDPEYAEAHHNLGVCLRMNNKPHEALRYLQAARDLGLDVGELYHNLGNARIDIEDTEGAVDAYRQAVERNPGHLESHRNLNTLLWQQGHQEDYLKSYQQALAMDPGAIDLRLAWAMALVQQDACEEAARVIDDGLCRTPESAELLSLLAYSLEGQDRWEEALQKHAAAVRAPDAVPNHSISYARALLACQRPDEALLHAEPAAREMPMNQRAIAYLGLCWRLLGDERDALLNDYETLVMPFDLPVPAAYANAAEFNEALTAVLDRLHIGTRHPPAQTLRGGSQTYGDLFDRSNPEIRYLISSLEECVNEYIGTFPRNPRHPLFARRTRTFRFSASWSVRLARCGFHTMHTHPMGWISSAYYVQVPSEVAESDAHGGGIKFGQPDIDLGPAGEASRHIQPSVGRLVLFPSYMWHGTVPFESDEPRMTVAFDAVPHRS